MELTGQQTIAAPRERVWQALNDPATLKACLPGCESVERVSPEQFTVRMRVAIGPLRANFQGKLVLAQATEPESCLMQFEGQGGAIGFGKGSSEVTLTPTEGGTVLAYKAQAQVGGKLAQIGSRLIDSFAKKMTDDFFLAFRQQLEPAPATAPAAASGPVSPAQLTPAPAGDTVTHAAPSIVAVPPMAQPLVPAWWLAPAAVLGALLVIVGAHWMPG